jgi:4,5-dihydroxyphthalate decarboxylase
MSKLQLTLACWDYDRTRPLLDGTVQPEGIDLNGIVLTPAEPFNRMLLFREFDISEMSFASYIMLLARGDTSLVSVSAFVSREFRHSCIYINSGSGIERPEEPWRQAHRRAVVGPDGSRVGASGSGARLRHRRG